MTSTPIPTPGLAAAAISQVVVVDDSQSALNQMLALLRTVGNCTPIGFTDPEEGLLHCLKHDIDLVVVDYEMPGINGVRFIESFRDDARKASVPVVMVTSTADRNVRYAALQVGATDFLGKPIDPVEFVARMDNLLAASQAFKTLAGLSQWLTGEVRKISTVVHQSPNSVMITDPDGVIGYVNPSFTATTGFTSAEVLGRAAADLMIETFSPEKRAEIQEEIEAGQEWRGTCQGHRKDGSAFWQSVRIFAIRDEAGAITNLASVSEDITLHKEYEARLAWQNNYDALTRLPNGMLALDRLGQAIAHAELSGSRVAVLRIGIDRFKLVSEAMGRAAGDDLLRQAAQRLQADMRPDGTLAHIGNGDFALIQPDVEDSCGLGLLIDTIRHQFVTSFAIEDKEVFTSVTAGVALYPADGATAADLMRNALSALGTAQAEEQGGWRLFASEPGSGASCRMQVENKLRRALADGELSLHYQPVVAADTGEILAAEALLRWRNRDLGTVPPEQFIPIAEETGLIVPIGAWVVERACHDMAEWSARGLKPLRVSINVSGRQLAADAPVDILRRVLKTHGLCAERLEIEVTERLLLDRSPRALAVFEEMRSMGLRISIDDFGTGYLPMSYLTGFPFDRLKIDRSLISRVAEQGQEASLAQATIAMAKSLNLEVVAEGVETKRQLDFLRCNGCDFAQGFLFAKPMPAEQFAALLADGTRYTIKADAAVA